MISYSVYKIVHLTGVLMVFLSLGGVAAASILGAAKDPRVRKWVAITHGSGMVISLVGGFGLLARLGIVHGGLPGWVMAKLAIWVIFGAMIALLARKPALVKSMWFVMIFLGVVAAYLAGSKPF